MRESVQRTRQVCPVEVAVAALGGAWKLTLVKDLLEEGTLRRGELQRRLPEARERTLTRQLRELETDGVVERIIYPEVPPRVEYRLTRLGASLRPVVAAMNQWGKDFEAAWDAVPADGADGPMLAG